MLNRSSDFYIEEAKMRQIQLAHAVGYCLFFFTAIYIGYIVISFFAQYVSGIASASGGG
jgi:hypothetical protein